MMSTRVFLVIALVFALSLLVPSPVSAARALKVSPRGGVESKKYEFAVTEATKAEDAAREELAADDSMKDAVEQAGDDAAAAAEAAEKAADALASGDDNE